MPKTIVPSPKSLLDTELRALRGEPASQPRYANPSRSCWSTPKLADGTVAHCGQKVYCVSDERHIGEIVLLQTSMAKVRWIDAGHNLVSFHDTTELRLANPEDYQ